MQALSISSASTCKIESIEVVNEELDLIDIEVEGQHTFWVSDNDHDWTLTHNSGAPDIDTDLADRDKVLEQLRNFFGWENVVPISNYNTFKLKTLVKDIGKFYGVPFEETNAATRSVEDEVRKATMKEGDDKNLFVLTYDEAMGFHCARAKEPEAKPVCQGCTPDCKTPVSPSFRQFIEKYPVVAESIKILFKQNRSLGRHAGGVLIADDLPNKMPLVTSKGDGGKREPQSPWVEGVNYKHLEKIGEFIKYDLLGLETLRLIERTIELILIKEGKPHAFEDVKRWYEEHLHPSVIDFDDPKPYEVYEKGRWGGIFQCVDSETTVTMADGTQKPIRQIEIGDEVRTYDEEMQQFVVSPVDRVYDQSEKECVELELDDGRKLVCTADHPVLTQRGWIEAGELTTEDEVLGVK